MAVTSEEGGRGGAMEVAAVRAAVATGEVMVEA